MKPLNFGQMLEEILHVKRLKNNDLAKKMGGLNPSNITRYLKQKKATPELIQRISQALKVEIIKKDGEYIWIDLSNNSKEFDTPTVEHYVEENVEESYGTNLHIERAKALVKKRLHDAIVEACMQTPEKYRPDVFKYFLQYQDSSPL